MGVGPYEDEGPFESEGATQDSPSFDALLRHAFDGLLEGCWVIGFDERYLYMNDTAAAHGRHGKEQMIGRLVTECFPGIVGTPTHEAVRRCLTLRTHEQMETEYVFPDGEARWFELRFVPIPEGVFGLTLDVTERRRAEGDRARLREELQQARRLETVGRLAGGVAHDFNNLLTAILSYADAALDNVSAGPEGDRLRADLLDIREAGRRAASLTNRLLAFSRQQVLEPRLLDLSGVVTGTKDALQRLGGERLTLELRLGEGLPQVLADPLQVEQVLLHLAANARDAMPEGGRLTIETRAVQVDARGAGANSDLTPGLYVVLRVADTGRGMTAETRERLFEPFFTTKGPAPGAGLGLASVHGVVKQTGGAIVVDTQPERGTSFRLYFPAAEPAPGSGTTPRASADPAGVTILLVEDDGAILRISTRVLAGAGYRVLSAASPAEALRVANDHAGTIDLLLTDVALPGMTGRELAERLRLERPELRILYMSGYTDDALIQRRVHAPGVGFIAKPFNGREILQKIEQLLNA